MRPDGALRTWCSPGRIDLIGDADYCLSVAMAPGCLVSASILDEDVLELAGDERAGYVPTELLLAELTPGVISGGWQASAAGVVWALRELGLTLPGLSLSVEVGPKADPALACAAAIADLCALELDSATLLAVALRARRDFAGELASGADEIVSMFAQVDHVTLCSPAAGVGAGSESSAFGSSAFEAIALDLEAAGLALLAVDCRASADLSAQAAECAEAARRLGVATLSELTLDDLDHAVAMLGSNALAGRVRHIVTEQDRTQACGEMLRAGHIRTIGPLLIESGESLRADFGVIGAEAELAVAVMLAFNAFGARVTGDGWAVGLLTPYQARAAAVGIRSAFSGRGYQEPVSHPLSPAGGLARA